MLDYVEMSRGHRRDIHIHIHTYIYIYIHTYTYTHIHIYICIINIHCNHSHLAIVGDLPASRGHHVAHGLPNLWRHRGDGRGHRRGECVLRVSVCQSAPG